MTSLDNHKMILAQEEVFYFLSWGLAKYNTKNQATIDCDDQLCAKFCYTDKLEDNVCLFHKEI